ncbi:hypothetical protein K5X82_17150 [Halosquirtibacter xylanolyticus]|uniref:hypothetical protein n=1 Tax=Halosquirtibacter xylanolyticus TaxID=3374599 RepID=UPI0037484AAA|nr:hypothetical protein K5X82_17150 [Prolixibacteraceae bacterium]
MKMTNIKTISIAMIEYAYRRNLIGALQLYYLLQPIKTVRFDTETCSYCMKQLSISYSTLMRRFNQLRHTRWIKPHRNDDRYFVVQAEKHILEPYLVYSKGQLHWRPHYQIVNFKIIVITALMFQTAIFREIRKSCQGESAQLRKRVMSHCKIHPDYGRIYATRHFRIPSNYYAKALQVSLMQYYRYRKKAYDMTLLSVTMHDLKVNIPSQRLKNVRTLYKDGPYIANKKDGAYLQEATSIHFNLFISPCEK